MKINRSTQPGSAIAFARTAKLCADQCRAVGRAETLVHQARRTRLLAGASLAVLLAGSLVAGSATAQTVATTTTLQVPTDNATITPGFQEATTGDATLTIDLDDQSVTAATIINDSSGSAGQALNIVVLDVDPASFDGGNALTIGGPVAASNNGTITLQVGVGSEDDFVLIIQDDITETSGGVVRIETGVAVTASPIVLAFDRTSTSQRIDAAISSLGGSTTVRVDSSVVGAGTTTFTDAITLNGTTDEIQVRSGTGSTTAVFEANVTAEIEIHGSTVVLGRSGSASTVTGTINSRSGASTLSIADGADVSLDGVINATSGTWDSITVGAGAATSFTLNGTTSNAAPITLSDNAVLQVDTSGPGGINIAGGVFADAAGSFTTLRVIGDGTVNAAFTGQLGANGNRIDLIDLDASATFSNAPHFLGALDVAAGATAGFAGFGTNFASISGDVSGEGDILISNLSNVLTFDGGTTPQTISTPILFNVNQQGIIQTANTAGLTFNGPIGGANVAQDVNIAAGNIVTFNGAVLTDGFEVLGPDTVVTINGGEAGTATSAISGGRLQIGQSILILGSNIGDGDTVFDFPSSDRPIMPGSETIFVRVSAHVGEGDEIVLFSTDDDQSQALDSVVNLGAANGEVFVVDTALTDFSLNLATVTATSDAAITLTATDRSTEETSQILGVSEVEVLTLTEAIEAAETAGEAGEETLAAISEALNEGTDNPQAAAAIAQQVGVQSDGLGAGSSISAFIAGEQRTMTGNRLAAQRTGSRFASAFAQTGFSGGDPGEASPDTGSFWLQAFGGIASADGDAGRAGFDSNFGGLSVGLDGAVNDQITMGAFGGYTFADVDGQGTANTQLETTSYQVGVYGSFTGRSFYLDGFASVDFSDNSATRNVTVPVAGTYTADFNSSLVSLALAGGVPIEMRDRAFITPNASLAWNHYSADGYTETGTGVLANVVSSVSATQLTGTVGARFHAVYENFGTQGTSFIPELRLGLSYDLIDDGGVVTARFVGGANSYTVNGTDVDDLAALIGLGLAVENSVWSAGITYDADLRSDHISHTARAEFRWKF